MNSKQIVAIIREAAGMLDQNFDGLALAELEASPRNYSDWQAEEFRRDVAEAANRQRLLFLQNSLEREEFSEFIKDVEIPVFALEKSGEEIVPVLFFKRKREVYVHRFATGGSIAVRYSDAFFHNLHQENGKIVFQGVFGYRSMVSEDAEESEESKILHPVQRLIRLFSEERRDIFYIYVYAILIGLISLTLPLGIQATIGLISGGVIFSSVYVLIGLVILGVFAAGGLQIMQITLVEFLQRRVFTKAAFEFAFRVPRIKNEALLGHYAPELINRFFDVMTIQKGMPKLLIDLSAAGIQILFGLILLSFYHPFFVFFSLFLVGTLVLIFLRTGPKGLESSIRESKYKYRVVYWLEELARTINSFKLSGNSNLPMRRTDYNVNNYLKNRKSHFGVLVSQYTFILLFKGLVTGGLLILGTILVVQREITLGQFVASEVIIILTLNSVEKLFMYMDVVYDMLTAVDKISQVTDLPLERTGGLDIPRNKADRGFDIRVKDLRYKFPDANKEMLKGVDLEVNAGEHVVICGQGGAGKTVLTNVISGLHTSFEGIVTLNGYSIRDLDLWNLRDRLGQNVSREDIFDGTILENILVGKPHASPDDAVWAINQVGIADEINMFPAGLDTPIISAGKGLSSTLVSKIILARCLAKRPGLLILNDFFNDLMLSDRANLIKMLNDDAHSWTLLVVSNDPLIMAACQRVIVMEDGRIKADGPFDELIANGALNEICVLT